MMEAMPNSGCSRRCRSFTSYLTAAVLATALPAYASYTEVHLSGEPDHREVFDGIYGGTFLPTGAALPNGYSTEYSNGTVTLTRMDDDGIVALLNMLLGSPGSADDDLWTDGVTTAMAEARFAGHPQEFGYDMGAGYVKLFDVSGSGFAVTGSGMVTFGPGSTWEWSRVDDSDGGPLVTPHYSEESSNSDGLDHMVTYYVTGLPGVPATSTVWLLCWEDLNGPLGSVSDRDFNDLVVELVVQECVDASQCDDDDACTVESCTVDGVCEHDAVTCPDNGDFCTDAACDPLGADGNCDAVVPANEGVACDDGDACNTGETCQGGDCTGGSPVICPDNGDDCTDLACDPAGLEGNCDLTVNVNESGPCDDGLFCTVSDTCTAGVCDGVPRDCSLAEPIDCVVGICDENADACTTEATDEGLPCDDGDPCNTGETCTAGSCNGGSPVTCPDNGDDCTDLACDPGGSEGNCDLIVNVNENGPCDDGLFCTVADTCILGVCNGVPRDCSLEEPVDCLIGVCDENADECTTAATDEGLPCNDGNACNTGEACLAGSCTGGSSVICPDNGDDCTDLACDPGGLEGNCDTTVIVNENGPCDDGLFCTVADTCTAGVCNGVPRDCSLEEPIDCLVGVCDEDADDCTTEATDEGLPCNDGNACNTGEACLAGSCTGGNSVTCPDNGDPCTDLACDPGGSEGNCDLTVNVNEDGPCDDGLACSVGETCVAGVCQGGMAVTCPDNGDPCTDLACDPAGLEGNCDLTVNVNETGPCDDGLACNVGETCVAGMCQGGGPVVCPDNNDPCTDLECDPAGVEGNCDTLIDVNEGGGCDDGDLCTTDTCVAGSCVGIPIDCNDNDACTADSCNPVNGMCVNVLAVDCDDDNACTTDVCNPADGSCSNTVSVVCNDNSACTNDSCDPATGTCRFIKFVTCSDGDACTGDVCDPATGACVYEDNGLCGACCLPDGGCTNGGIYPDCIAAGGDFRQQQECLGDNDGDGMEDLCRASVPAVSEWGMAALSLLLLVGVAIKFGCEQRRAV